MPLDHALGIGERAVLLDSRRCRQEEDFGRDGFRVRHLWIGVPEAGALCFKEVPDNQPVEPPQGVAMQPGIRPARRRVLSHQERSPDVALVHLDEVAHLGEVFVDLGEPLVPVVVVLGGGFAIPGLEQADGELGHVGPGAPDNILLPESVRNVAPAGQIALAVGQVLRQGGVAGHRAGLWQVARQHVEQHGDVRRALDAGMPP